MNSNIKIIGRGDMAMGMFGIVKESVQAFIDDEALTRGAAIAFTPSHIGPVLFIVVAIAGLAFGEDAARGAISGQLSGLMASRAQTCSRPPSGSAAGNSAGFLAAATGIVTLVITASGVFMPPALVSSLGFLLLVSLVVSALVTALSDYIDTYLSFGHLILQVSTFLISFGFVSLLFGAIYKILPDRNIEWHDVLIGAVVTLMSPLIPYR